MDDEQTERVSRRRDSPNDNVNDTIHHQIEENDAKDLIKVAIAYSYRRVLFNNLDVVV
jgi:hypothetical protein